MGGSRGVLGRSWGRPGDVWGSHGGCLRPSWGLPKALGRRLGASWGRRGATWKPRKGLQEPDKTASRLHFVLACGKNHGKGVQKSASETLGGLSRFLFHFFFVFKKVARNAGERLLFQVLLKKLGSKCQTVAKSGGVGGTPGVIFSGF